VVGAVESQVLPGAVGPACLSRDPDRHRCGVGATSELTAGVGSSGARRALRVMDVEVGFNPAHTVSDAPVEPGSQRKHTGPRSSGRAQA
jgi:hypothetical protein